MSQLLWRVLKTGVYVATAAGALAVAPVTAAQSTVSEPVTTAPATIPGPVTTSPAVGHDTSPTLAKMIADAPPEQTRQQRLAHRAARRKAYLKAHPGAKPKHRAPPKPVQAPPVSSAAAAVEQTKVGPRPAAVLVASFDGLGVGFEGPRGATHLRNPSDDSLAVGPNRVVQIVNSDFAVYTKTGRVLQGPVPTRTIFAGFSGECGRVHFGDAVVRYDQLAKRWVFILPIFERPKGQKAYAVCIAISASKNLVGHYYRYEFQRRLFPDYPRLAVWPDGYYIGTSTGDTVIQKSACVVERRAMLRGRPAREQCSVINGVNFLNPADIDGRQTPPVGTPALFFAAGGTQLKGIFDAADIYYYKFHADWAHPGNSRVSGPFAVPVAPYHYLCNGQLTSCVPQPGTSQRLDAQGDKLMQRVVYRRRGAQQSILAVHSVNTKGGGGGVRWYEFRLDGNASVQLYQQGTYAPSGGFRWLPSIDMDRAGNIAIGYSYGDAKHYVSQRLTGRLAGDGKGKMTFGETVLAKGDAAQTDTWRWEDYTTMDIDPANGCTFWYVGDYFKAGAKRYSTRIGAMRLPSCR